MNGGKRSRYVLDVMPLYGLEMGHVGRVQLAAPVMAAVAVALVGLLLGRWEELLVTGAFPLLAALPVAGAVATDPARELQESFPGGYWRTVSRRVTLVLAAVTTGAVALALLTGAGLPALSAWCSVMLLVGLATAAGAWLPSPSAAATVVVAGWLGEVLLLGRSLPGVAPAVFVLCAGVILIGTGLRRLATVPLADRPQRVPS